MPATREEVRKYRQRLRKRAWKLKGRRCVFCRKRATEMAHVCPTELSGSNSRGMDRRYRDVLKNPDCYEPMCHGCHVLFDGFVRKMKVLVEKEEPIPF